MAKADRGRVLVAGGAGFIGSHLVDRLLAGGWAVTVLDNLLTGHLSNLAHVRAGNLDVIVHDVIDELPANIRCERIFNLACAASPIHYRADPEHTMLTNVLGTRNLLRLAERRGARLLLASTSEVYGDPEVHPQPEDYRGAVNATGPRACYDEGKRAAETLAFDFRRGARADVRVARIFNTYGPRMRPDDGRVVSTVILQALANADITVNGSGRQTRSFCYVDDMVEALVRLMDHPAVPGSAVNLGNPEEIAVIDLAGLVRTMTGSASRIVHRPLPEDDPCRRRPVIGRAAELLGWQPTTPLATGLHLTIRHFTGRAGIRPAVIGGTSAHALAPPPTRPTGRGEPCPPLTAPP